jgi:membrane protease YdiL (CAAX protease family)
VLFYTLPICVAAFMLKGSGSIKFDLKFPTFSDIFYICIFFTLLAALSSILSLVFPNDIPDYKLTAESVIISGIIAPIFEELLWRGIIFKELSRYSRLIAILFSSLLFALLHDGKAGMIYAFAGGIIFSFLYIQSESLIPGMILHLTNNLIASLSPVFPQLLLIALITSLSLILLANTIFRKNVMKPNITFCTATDSRIFSSPLIYLTLIYVIILRNL